MQGPNAPWGCTLCSSAPYACPTHERHATRCAVVHRGSNPVTMACMMNGERSHETFVSCLLQALLRCCKGAVRHLGQFLYHVINSVDFFRVSQRQTCGISIFII